MNRALERRGHVLRSGGLVDADRVLAAEAREPPGKERLECRALFTEFTAARTKFFLLGFRAIGSDYRFSKGKTRMTVVVDGQRIYLGAPFGRRRDTLIGAEEIMYFQLSWAQLKKIGSAKKVEFQIDRLTSPLSEDARALIKELATATS